MVVLLEVFVECVFMGEPEFVLGFLVLTWLFLFGVDYVEGLFADEVGMVVDELEVFIFSDLWILRLVRESGKTLLREF